MVCQKLCQKSVSGWGSLKESNIKHVGNPEIFVIRNKLSDAFHVLRNFVGKATESWYCFGFPGFCWKVGVQISGVWRYLWIRKPATSDWLIQGTAAPRSDTCCSPSASAPSSRATARRILNWSTQDATLPTSWRRPWPLWPDAWCTTATGLI